MQYSLYVSRQVKIYTKGPKTSINNDGLIRATQESEKEDFEISYENDVIDNCHL